MKIALKKGGIMRQRKFFPLQWPVSICLILIISAGIGFCIYRNLSTRFSLHCYPDTGNDYVVLLHGIGGVSLLMVPLSEALHKQGYTVINVNYPSTKYDIPEIAEIYLDSVIRTRCVDRERKVHFVTHSMGGIVTRYYLKHHLQEINLGRVVMLAPPNSGSEIVDAIKPGMIIGEFLGPALYQLGTETQCIVHTLGKPDYEFGIITGNRGWFIPGSLIIPGKDDGMVSVNSASLEGASDFKVTDSSHSFIMVDRGVVEDVINFLKKGCFKT